MPPHPILCSAKHTLGVFTLESYIGRPQAALPYCSLFVGLAISSMKEDVLLANESEWKPWYRRKDYKGNLTEDQKRYLDSFRSGKPHPATPFEDLPDEVQSRLIELEEQLKEQQDATSLLTMLVWFSLSSYAFYSGYNDYDGLTSVASYCFALFVIFILYKSYKAYLYRHKHHNWYGDTDKGEPFSSTDESLQRHWEVNPLSAYDQTSSDDG